jgi:hypothetical protein
MIVMSEEKVLIAVSVSSIHRASDARYMTATLRADSTTKDASFSNFETAMFSGHSLVPFETLRDYGFTVVEPPGDWRYDYQKSWHEAVIRQAIEQASAFQSHYQRRDMRGGYDKQLAEEVLEVINQTYPQLTNLIQLKHQLGKEPSDEALSIVLSALQGDGFIDGAAQHAPAKLNPLVRITITKDGRRHLEDEMKKKTAKTKQEYGFTDASRFILTQLLSEFRERQLTVEDLRNTYQGMSPDELKTRFIAHGHDEVDYNLAMSDLDEHDLVKTGPLVAVENDPRSGVIFLLFRSENKYSYLTENGYKAARNNAGASPATKSRAAEIHISGGTFHNSPIGVGDGFAQTIISATSSLDETMSAFRAEVNKLIDDADKRQEILLRLDELEAATDKPTIFERYNHLVATIGDHITVLGFLLPPLLQKLLS